MLAMRRRRAPNPTTSAARGRPTSPFDSNGDDKILSEELAALLASLCHPPSEEELRRMMVEANSNGDGFISVEEFVEINTPSASTDEDLRLAFAIFDLDRNDIIFAEELFRGLSRIEEGASGTQCRRMIQGVDRDGDSLISSRSLKP
ncbi:hypothetical protein ZIOFF_052511 [Zingiber officinale]|uniref:EF-hand domain-containing protein n=1 Tax=Zingiber officinale TaxID=94328 RepID=A0A8J5KVH5_ZINOF|nr:hypothetical protein ZIOFF_052511 [Zingiber officinale]